MSEYIALWRELINKDDLGSLKQLMEDGWDPQAETLSPLAHASLRARPQIVRWLSDLGVVAPHSAPVSAIHAASSGPLSADRKEVIQMLLDDGASLSGLNRSGRTPLMCAVAVDALDTGLHLLSLGAKLDASNLDGKRAEDFFAGTGEQAKARFLQMALEHNTPQIEVKPTTSKLRRPSRL